MTPITKDPFDVTIEEKIALLLSANENALKVGKVKFVTSGLQLLKEVKTLLTTEGTNITQTFIRVGTAMAMPPAKLGDMLLADAAYSNDGTSRTYAPVGYPAVADFDLGAALREAHHMPRHSRTDYTLVVVHRETVFRVLGG